MQCVLSQNQQGESMGWKNFLPSLLFSSVLVISLFVVSVWDDTTPSFGPHPLVVNVIMIIMSTIGLVGFEELKRGGHRKIRRNLLVCLAILLILPLILAFTRIHMHWKITGMDFSDYYLFVPFNVLLVGTFPLALYLNRNQKKSSAESTVADTN
jgi:phosphatidylserine synthase